MAKNIDLCPAKVRRSAHKMDIHLTNAGKRFRFDWIFQGLSQQLSGGQRVAITGPNGSGKSTLMKVLAGHLSLSKGDIRFFHGNAAKPLEAEAVYQYVSYAAPYIELIEEFTLEEAIAFHSRLKPLIKGLDAGALLDILELPKARHKEIRFFSSGMKQRVKLALALCSDVPLILLDEPSTNLDVRAVDWYHQLTEQFVQERLLVIATNDPADLSLCNTTLDIMAFKPVSGRNKTGKGQH